MYEYEKDPTAPAAAAALVEKWTKIAFRTELQTPEEQQQVIQAVKDLYTVSDLPVPRAIILSPSPLFSRALAGLCTLPPPKALDPTKSALHRALHAFHNNIPFKYDPATDPKSTPEHIRATVDSIHGREGLDACTEVVSIYQGGNELAWSPCFIEFGRTHVKLDLDYSKYEPWHTLAELSGWRFVHADFCIVSDFPIAVHVANDVLHNETGPARLWSDGFAIYSVTGVSVPAHWVEDTANIDPKEVIATTNVEQRAIGARLCGWPKMLQVLEQEVIDDSEDGKYPSNDIGSLITLRIPGLPEPGLFLKAVCPRNGIICEEVPRNAGIKTARDAQAWRHGKTAATYKHSPFRT